MKKIIDIINLCISKKQQVVVFTQSHELVNEFLFRNPGKWTCNLSDRFWPVNEFVTGNAKVSFNSPTPQVGLDMLATDVIFTKNPGFKCQPGSVIIKTPFKSPNIELSEYACHSSNMKGSDFFPHDPQRWRRMLAVMGDNETRVHDKIKYVASERAVIAYGVEFSHVHTASFHDTERVIVSKDVLMDNIPTREQCMNVMECIGMAHSAMKGSSVDADWISRHCIVNIFVISRTLQMLKLMKLVKEIVVDDSTVVIQKKPPFPNDIEFGSIPEGMFKMVEIQNLLGNSAISIIKKYEGNGLVFGFNEKKHRFYKPTSYASRSYDDDYHNTAQWLLNSAQQWKNVEGNAKWLDAIVQNKVVHLARTHDVYLSDIFMVDIEKIGEVTTVAI